MVGGIAAMMPTTMQGSPPSVRGNMADDVANDSCLCRMANRHHTRELGHQEQNPQCADEPRKTPQALHELFGSIP
jgi:hypothetical protein